MEMTPDTRVYALTMGQAGLISRGQALAAGVTDRMIGYRLATGRWVRRHPGVYAVGGVPSGWRGDVWAAHLAIGPPAVVSHETALVLHGLDVRHVPRYPLTFTVPHGANHRVPGAVLHQIDDVAHHHLVEVDRLPVTTPARAIVDLAAHVGPRRLGDLVDLATDRLTSIARISAFTAELARPGKPGMVRLGAALDARGPGHVPPQSVLESGLLSALADGDLPAPVRQFRLPGRGALDGLVDAAYPDVRLVLEADGRRWHTRIRDLRRDHLRDAEAARAGWQTLRFLYEEITAFPQEIVATVTDVRRIRAAQLGRCAG
jgi:Transcriptional regulator, AbiEi antitoxin/Protein of unknown function (DUF559)